MVGLLRRVVVKRPEDAFHSASAIQQQWRDLAYTRPPDLERAAREHKHFVSLLRAAGAESCTCRRTAAPAWIRSYRTRCHV